MFWILCYLYLVLKIIKGKMSGQIELILILMVLSLIFFMLWRNATKKLREVRYQKRSLSSKYGKITEQFLPFLDCYPYEPGNFRFIGTPIDGIQFEEDKIIFLEFKSGDSRLSKKQSNIRELIHDHQISFEEIDLKL
jgi:predicted Holliday junction resolvase-like endonuclease